MKSATKSKRKMAVFTPDRMYGGIQGSSFSGFTLPPAKEMIQPLIGRFDRVARFRVLEIFILVGQRRQVLRRCQDMKPISGNLGGTVGSRNIADIATLKKFA